MASSQYAQQANGLNDAGDIVGFCYDSSGHQHGYLAHVVGPVFTTLDHRAAGINNLGQIVGSYVDTYGVSYGYLYSGGTYKTLSQKNIVATGINDSGQIVGYSITTAGTFGFVENGGTLSLIKDPSATGNTYAMGIHKTGQIVGYYTDNSGVHGFLYGGGSYKTLDDPLATNATFATGINASGQIAGYYYNGSGAHSFLFSGGGYTTLDDPLATNGTFASGINDAGDIVGHYYVGSTENGFVYSGGVYTPINDPSAVGGSAASGINNAGQIVGLFDESTKSERGFVTNLVMEDFFTAVESKTGDKITGAVLDDTGKYSVGSIYHSGTDNVGGTWTYTVTSIQVAASPFQNPAYNGCIYDATYYDHDLNATFNTNVGAKGFAGTSPQNVSGTSYFGSDNDSVTINGKFYKIGHLYVVPDPALALVTPISSQLSVTHHDQSFAASSLFTASDPDADAIAQFGFWDTGMGGGHFVLNGIAQGINQEIDVTAAQLSQLSYQSGSATETLWVRANDGTQWSGWSSSFSVTGQVNTPAVVTVANLTAAHGQGLAASSLFTASDPDGDAITQYGFWDTGTAGGHFALSGVAQGINQEIMASTFVAASDGHGGTLISEAAQTSAQSPLLTQPHG